MKELFIRLMRSYFGILKRLSKLKSENLMRRIWEKIMEANNVGKWNVGILFTWPDRQGIKT